MPTAPTTLSADVLVIGWGLAGLVAAGEAVAAGKRVVIVDQESRTNLGGQAWWSFGGLFFVDSPEQRRLGIKDSLELARQDWFGTAAFDRDEDAWPRRWAEAYLQFAHQEKRAWLREKGVGFFPIVGWAERGGYTALGQALGTKTYTTASLVASFDAADVTWTGLSVTYRYGILWDDTPTTPADPLIGYVDSGGDQTLSSTDLVFQWNSAPAIFQITVS